MFLPIGHDRMIRGVPWVTIVIIGLCTLVHFYSEFMSPGEELEGLLAELDYATSDEELADIEVRAEAIVKKLPVLRWGYETGSGFDLNALWSSFVHQGWFHLIGNMLFLWLAGSLLENRWGHWRYLLFYVGGAVTATLIFDALYDGPPTILIGASGAVSATLGAFLVLFHNAKIRIWYWLFIRYTGTFEVAAYVALPLWFADQMFWALLQSEGDVTGVAHTAHIAGFLFGLAIAYASHVMGSPEHSEIESAHGPYGSTRSKSLPRAVVVNHSSTAAEPGGRTKQMQPSLGQQTQELALEQTCMTALQQGDWAALEENASALIVDFAKHRRHERIVELYCQIQEGNQSFPFTDEALAKAAGAADRTDRASLYLSCAAQLATQHPESPFIPGILWRVAELQRLQGRADLAEVTLRELVQDHPEHYCARKAREQLGG